MATEQTLIISKTQTISDEAIQTRLFAAPGRELYANTAIRAGRHGPTCWNENKTETIECCEAIPKSESHQFIPARNGQWYCMYADSGTGDWD